MVTKHYYYDYTEQLSQILSLAKHGQTIKLAYLGGSITQGCTPSVPELAYAVRFHKWLQEKLAPIKVECVNAGIGATGSLIGSHRLQEDIIKHKPDIVIVEFAANDVPPTKSSRESYESIIRSLRINLPDSAIVELFMTLEDGVSGEAQQTQIGHHYKVPMVSYRQEVFNAIDEGKYTWQEIAVDNVHPNDKGHEIITQLLKDLFEVAMRQENKIYHAELPEVLFSDRYCNSMIFNHHNFKPMPMGDFVLSEDGFRTLKDGWICNGKSNHQSLAVDIEAKSIYLLYKKCVGSNKGKIQVKVDGKVLGEVDSSFENGWGDYAETYLIVLEDEVKRHHIEMLMIDEDPDTSFTILGFLVSK